MFYDVMITNISENTKGDIMIFITGDTHGDFSRFKDSTTKKIRRGDTLIICGDFGFIWDGSRTEKQVLKKISDLKYTVAFIDGCHENFSLLNEYPVEEWNGGSIHRIADNIVHLMRGQVFTIEGKKFFTFGGGHSQDVDIRRETNTWFSEEQPTLNDIKTGVKSLIRHDKKINYIITHEPPQSLKKCLDLDLLTRLETDTFFDQLNDECTYDKWFFGKCHMNKIIPQKYYALFDNVIMLDPDE